jgi:hypothetical protein
MRDYRKYIGRTVSVMTLSGSFQGMLQEVGRESLTVRPTAYYYDDGQRGPTPSGVVIIDRYAITFVQVN